MQLSFPSVPSDPAAGFAVGNPPAPEGDAKTPADPQAISALGFAQLLAAFVPGVPLTSLPPTAAAIDGADAAAALGEGGAGGVASTLPSDPFPEGANGVNPSAAKPGREVGTDPRFRPASESRPRRTLLEQSELQSVAMTTAAQLTALPEPSTTSASVPAPSRAAPSIAPLISGGARFNRPTSSSAGQEEAPIDPDRAPSIDFPLLRSQPTVGPSERPWLDQTAATPAKDETGTPLVAESGEPAVKEKGPNEGVLSDPRQASAAPIVTSPRLFAPNSLQGQLPSSTLLRADPPKGQEGTPAMEAARIAEKIAAGSSTPAATDAAAENDAPKSFVRSEHKAVTKYTPTLGIGVAEEGAKMPVGSTLPHPTVSESPAALPAVSGPETHQQMDALPAPVALTSTAHKAVEAVLSVTDRFASREQHSVNLQFTVGGSDLSVRVEMRGGEVHTTFRTDSSELRTALANEWQAVTAQNQGERAARLAPPVFAGNDQGGMSFSSSGDGAPRHQQQDARANDRGLSPSFATFEQSASATVSPGAATSTPVTRSVGANSVHLHTFA